MAFFKGQTTDYQAMMDIIKNLAKDDHISALACYDGGTGYEIGDVIDLAGGVKFHEPELEVRGTTAGDYITVAAVNAAGTGYNIGDSLVPTTGTYDIDPVLEVLTLSGSAVATILIKNPGVASAQPSNPVETTSDGSGTGCEIDLTFTAGTGIITVCHIADAGTYTTQATNPVSQNTSSGAGTGAKFDLTYLDTAWETLVDFEAYEATTAAISVAGTGYAANDIVTIVGGVYTEPASVKILTVSLGVPLTIELYTAGEYDTTPGNPASVSGGAGSGLTLTITYAATVIEHKYLMLHNTNTHQYVGWKSIKETSPETAYVLQCNGFTGFNSSTTPWDQHPGAITTDEDNEDNYVPLSGGASPATISYWISIQDKRITAAYKVASVYPNMYLGGLNEYLTSSEYAYSQLILGCLARKAPFTYGGDDFGGMNNPGVQSPESSSYGGPGWLRRPGGLLEQVVNWYISFGNPASTDDYINITPCAGTNYATPVAPNAWYNNADNWKDMFTITSTVSAGQEKLLRIDTDFVLLPCTLVSRTHNRIYGDMIGIFCLNPDTAVNSEDRIWIGNQAYRCFQNCQRSNRNYFYAMRED
jgi:hypothetical protein